MGPTIPTLTARVAGVALVAALPLFALLAGAHWLPFLLMPAVMLLPAFITRGRPAPPEPPADGGGGGGDGGSPLLPDSPTGGGGVPLPDAAQSSVRLRGPGRPAWAPPRGRRPAHRPAEVPASPRIAPRR